MTTGKANFKPYVKAISTIFHVPVTTVQKWVNADNRQEHCRLLVLALEAINCVPLYGFMLDSGASAVNVGQKLGFDNPTALSIPGLPSRTVRSWFETPEKRHQLIGILIGFHWQTVKAMACDAGFSSAEALANYAHQSMINLGRLSQLYGIDPETVTQLLKTHSNNTNEQAGGSNE